MKQRRSSTRILPTRILLAASIAAASLSAPLLPAAPTTAPADDPEARVKALEAQVAGLQKQLSDSHRANDVLQQQNSALLGRLAAAPKPQVDPANMTFGIKPKPTASPTTRSAKPAPTRPGPIVAILSDPTWDASGNCPPQTLAENLDAKSIAVKLSDDALSVDPSDPTSATLNIRKVNRGLGTNTYSPVGKITLENNTLGLQWTDQANTPAAIAAMKFAVVQLIGGATPSSVQFFKPADVSIELSHSSTTKFDAPDGLPTNLSFALAPDTPAPSGWQVQKFGERGIGMKADSANWTLAYTSLPPSLLFSRGGNATTKLDAAKAELKARQEELQKLNQQPTAATAFGGPTSSDRANTRQRTKEIADQRASLSKGIAAIQQNIQSLTIDAAAEEKLWSALDNTAVELNTANGARVAEITLTGSR